MFHLVHAELLYHKIIGRGRNLLCRTDDVIARNVILDQAAAVWVDNTLLWESGCGVH